jgi:hypothetical protein
MNARMSSAEPMSNTSANETSLMTSLPAFRFAAVDSFTPNQGMVTARGLVGTL